jgi:hypothetical protein
MPKQSILRRNENNMAASNKFAPQLGDRRANLLGEVVGRDIARPLPIERITTLQKTIPLQPSNVKLEIVVGRVRFVCPFIYFSEIYRNH